jgi:ribosomal-protein-alanine N-acetyltransferase
MGSFSIKVLKDIKPDITLELKKLEISNLGPDASINEWIIPVFIKYGKIITVVESCSDGLKNRKKIIAVNELLKKWEDSQTVFIHSFYVDMPYRKKGIGSLLLRKSIEILKEEKIKNIELTVDPKNMGALRLYESFNFKKKCYQADLYGKGVHRVFLTCRI